MGGKRVKKSRAVQVLKTAARVKSRSAKGRAWLERNPFLWLALQGEEASPRNVWLFVFAILAIWLIAALKLRNGLMARRRHGDGDDFCSACPAENLDCGGSFAPFFGRPEQPHV